MTDDPKRGYKPHATRQFTGEILEEYWNDPKKLNIYREEPPTFLKVWGPCIVTQMEHGTILKPEDEAELFKWLDDV